MDACGLHSFVCRRAPGRSARHHALNDLVARCFASARTPVTKDPTGLFRTDGKRSNGLTLVPWQSGKSLCWDVTVICPLAESCHLVRPRGRCCSGTRRFSQRGKYASIGSEYLFAPIAVETLGPMNTLACQLFANLGRKFSSASGDDREGAFLFQESREFRCWCSATTLYCFMTPCQPLTARTDDLYPIMYCLNF